MDIYANLKKEGPRLKKFYYVGFLLILLFFGIIMGSNKTVGETDNRMKVIIDRFEGEYAVMELPDKTTVNMPVKLLEPAAKEGDIIEIKILDAETRGRKNKLKQLMNEVFEK
jgi:hypothetical protein